jgi:hypothetical protein
VPYGPAELGAPQQSAVSLPPAGHGARCRTNRGATPSLGQAVRAMALGTPQAPPNGSLAAKPPLAELARAAEGFVHRFRRIIRPLVPSGALQKYSYRQRYGIIGPKKG